MKYSEIFYSIQGEGSLVGTPSVFFRTSFCNLKCSWCDTPYTSHTPENKDITIEEAVEKICNARCDNIVITGGEPFIQKKSLELLCRELHKLDKHITIETNGTIFHDVQADLISISPKTRNSLPTLEQVNPRQRKDHEKLSFQPLVLKKFLKEYDCQFKFVVSYPDDIREISAIIETIGIDRDLVYLMPEGRTKEEIEEKQFWLVNTCITRGFNYSDRLQVRLWGDKRGV